MSNIYAGIVSEKRDLATYNDKGDTVINLVIETTKTLVGSIKIATKKTVVLFRGEAEKANRELEVGTPVVFSEVSRSPRVYQTSKGSTVETVDMIAESFSVIKAKELKENAEALAEMSIDEESFTFTDSDREACEGRAQTSTQNEDEDEDCPI